MVRSPSDFFRTRPKQGRSQELVEAILTAAARVFRRSGIGETNTNEIAEIAGVSVGSLYRYFPNKESLVAALIERELSHQLEALDSVLEQAKDLSDSDAIQLSVRTLCDLYFENAEFLSLLFKEAHRVRQVQLVVLKHLNVERIVNRVLAKRGAGRSVRFPPRIFVAVNAVMGVLHSVVELYPETPDRASVTRETVTMMRKYLLPLHEL
jgi:AcrR family transcriptional regulator